MRFTVRRPASAEVSPCCHRPSGGDVACSVHVGVARPRAAGSTLENCLALAVFERDMSARGTSLRRVSSRDLLDPTTSLVLQTCGEQAPTAPVDRTVETSLLRNTHTRPLNGSARTARQRTNIKCLNADRIEAPRDVSRGLFDPILAAVALTRFELGDRHLRASSTVGAALGTREPLLQHLQPPRLNAAQTRDVQQFTSRHCRRHHNTTVDTHHVALTRTRDGFRHVGEPDKPAASPITDHPVGLHTLGDRPRQAEAHPADLGHPNPAESPIQTLDVMRFQTDLSKSLMHTGFAPPRATMGSKEKVAHRLSKIPQRLLLHSLRAGRQPVVFGAGSGQLRALLVVTRRVASGLPMLLLLDSQVPHIPGMAAMLPQYRRLLGGRKQPVSRHLGNVSITTDKSPKGQAGLLSPARARGSLAAEIR